MRPEQTKAWPRSLPTHLEVPRTNLFDNLQVTATRHPDHPAVIDAEGTLSYGDLLGQVEDMASILAGRARVRRGERVAIYMQNSRAWIVAYYAILRLGAVVLPINPMNKAGELSHYLAHAAPVAAFCDAANADELAAAEGASGLRITLVSNERHDPSDAPLPALEHHPDDLALILYSSGTTGQPKGCMHSHRSLWASAVSTAHWQGMTTQPTLLVALPFFHITGMQNMLNAPIHGGGTLVMLKRWDRDAAAEAIARHRVTHWTAMPTMVIDFLASPRLADYDLRSIRRIGGGGAGMPEAVALRLKEATGLDFLEGYGLSETAHVSGNPPVGFHRQCLGLPLFDTDLRIVDPDTLDELPAGEVGEIVVAGPQVFVGYWQDEAATRAATFEREGLRFVRTGDLGRRDADGFFFIVDRLKRMVNASGYKVWPTEVESLLHEHPAIAEACVIAAIDPYRGETVKAVVVLKAGLRGQVAEAEVIDWSRGRMAAYKYPRIVEFVDSLPRSATGKIMWRALQDAERAKASSSS